MLDRKKLPLEKAYGMATDGASVMTGVRAGVTTLTKKKNPFMLSTHCIALSFEGAVEAILANTDPLIAALISDSESDPTAKGILSFISTFQFLATTPFLADVLVLLSCLSKILQRQCVDFTAVSDGVESTVTALYLVSS